VVLNVTATNSTGPGYVQVLPGGASSIGAWSNLNVERTGQTIANLVIVPVGADGSVTFHTQGGGDLLADVFGYFVPTRTAQRAGRFTSVAPTRLADTRVRGRQQAAGAPLVLVVPDDAEALVMNVTVTGAVADGFAQAAPTGVADFGSSSNLNFTAGGTTPNLVVVPAGANHTVSLFVSQAADLVVDLLGYVTNDKAPEGTAGLLVALPPGRVVDTRNDRLLGPGEARRVSVSGRSGVPEGAAAAVLNVTATEAAGPGYVQVVPPGVRIGGTSTVNVTRAGQTVPNATIATLGAAGDLTLFAQTGAHVVLDVFGYFTEVVQ
jgi:hypothetical protein